jgi:hypothetical protein
MSNLRAIAHEIAIREAALRRDEFARVQKRLEASVKSRLEAKVRRQFESLWKQLARHAKQHGITPDLADDAIDWGRWQFTLALSIRGELRSLLESVGAQVDSVMGAAAGWDIAADPAVIAWLDRHTAELVVQVTEETRSAIRAVVRQNYLNWIGTTRQTMARDLRPIVGLTEYQAQVVQNYREFLEDQKDMGIYRSQKQIDAMVATKAEQIKRYRCKMIADTESVYAANQGALAAYRANPSVTASQWMVLSGNPCPECAALDGQIVAIDGAFAQTTVKVDGISEVVDVAAPPLHPNCGCRIIPVTIETEQDDAFWSGRQDKFTAGKPEGWMNKYKQARASSGQAAG